MLAKRCSGDHQHGVLISGLSRPTQKYSSQFVAAILRGLRAALKKGGSLKTPRRTPENPARIPADARKAGEKLGAHLAEVSECWMAEEAAIDQEYASVFPSAAADVDEMMPRVPERRRNGEGDPIIGDSIDDDDEAPRPASAGTQWVPQEASCTPPPRPWTPYE